MQEGREGRCPELERAHLGGLGCAQWVGQGSQKPAWQGLMREREGGGQGGDSKCGPLWMGLEREETEK